MPKTSTLRASTADRARNIRVGKSQPDAPQIERSFNSALEAMDPDLNRASVLTNSKRQSSHEDPVRWESSRAFGKDLTVISVKFYRISRSVANHLECDFGDPTTVRQWKIRAVDQSSRHAS